MIKLFLFSLLIGFSSAFAEEDFNRYHYFKPDHTSCESIQKYYSHVSIDLRLQFDEVLNISGVDDELKRQYRNWTAVCLDKAHRFSAWFFVYKLNLQSRQQLVHLYLKLTQAGLWDQVGSIVWVGNNPDLLFHPKEGEKVLLEHLTAPDFGKGKFGPWWFAKGLSDRWGLRSEFHGVELHFRGKAKGLVNAHIDLNNPYRGSLDQALKHHFTDLWDRQRSHAVAEVYRALSARGLRVPVIGF